MMVRCLVVAFLVVASLVPGAAQAQTPASTWDRTDFAFTSFDGTVLAASVWVPKATTPTPAILITNGWNNRHDTGTELRLAERYANQGYVVLGWTSRGWGNSGGEVELDGPKEQNDTRALIDLLSTNAAKWHIEMDGAKDPRVGMVGESYGGGIQLLTAQGDPRLDSLIPRITWNNLLFSLAPHDVLKIGWVSELYATGETVARGAPAPSTHPGDKPDANGPSQKLSEWYAESSAQNGPTDEMGTEIGWVRSVHPGALKAPTLLVQGWGDTFFPPDQAIATFADLRSRGVPVRLIFYPGGHGQSLADTDSAAIFVDQQMDQWFNATLRHMPYTTPPYPVLRYRDAEKDFAGELQWPPAGNTTWRGYLGAAGNDGLSAMPPAAATTDLVNPVFPATCVDVPSFQSQAGSNCPYTTPESSALWAGPALPADQEVTGTPMAHLVLTSTQPGDVRVFLTLADVDAAGKATYVGRQVMPMRTGASTSRMVDVAMQAVSHTFPAGHRIALQIATTDFGFYASREPGKVTIGAGSWLDIPMVPKDKWGDRAPPIIQLPHQGLVVVYDPGGVANVSFTPALNVTEFLCPGNNLECHSLGPFDGLQHRAFHYVRTLRQLNQTIRVLATDFAGGQSYATIPAGQGTCSGASCNTLVCNGETTTVAFHDGDSALACPPAPKKTPALGLALLAIGLCAVAVRRRRRAA
ncbi:MAG: CocE/NonD family hydrolase [bacterium]